jgi:hypothetical protein
MNNGYQMITIYRSEKSKGYIRKEDILVQSTYNVGGGFWAK